MFKSKLFTWLSAGLNFGGFFFFSASIKLA